MNAKEYLDELDNLSKEISCLCHSEEIWENTLSKITGKEVPKWRDKIDVWEAETTYSLTAKATMRQPLSDIFFDSVQYIILKGAFPDNRYNTYLASDIANCDYDEGHLEKVLEQVIISTGKAAKIIRSASTI